MSRPHAYYNEHDPFAAAWLRNLIAEGLIAPGDVDERSIEDVLPDDLRGYTQCHFFAGLGGWSYSLRLAGWPDHHPVWTGSCPCQPFSAAGKGAGFADERHLWPAFHWLISQRNPPVVFGEQVASKDGLAWLDLVRSDLEGTGHAFWAADLCAAGVGAPHIRQRLFWVADAMQPGRAEGRTGAGDGQASGCGIADRLADPDGRDARQLATPTDGHGGAAGSDGGALGMVDSEHGGREGRDAERNWSGPVLPSGTIGGLVGEINVGWPGAHHGGWADADWLFCTDGRWRPVEPGAFTLAHGVSGRVGRLRAYGNAIVPQAAAEFVAAYMEAAEAVRHGRGLGGVPAVLTVLDPELEEMLA